MSVFGGGSARDPRDGDDDEDLEGETSREVLEDLRTIGALPPFRPQRRAPTREDRASDEPPLPYDPVDRNRKDAIYGRNREAPPGSPPLGPPRDGTPGVRFEPAPITREEPSRGPGARFEERPSPPSRGLPARPSSRERPSVRLRSEQLPSSGGRPAPRAPVPLSRPAPVPPPRVVPVDQPPPTAPGEFALLRPGESLFDRLREGAEQKPTDMEARLALEMARRAEETRRAFVADFRREHPGATENDAEDAWGAKLRSSTLELD